MSREQWGHGYYRGLEDGMRSAISLFDFIVLRYGKDDTANGDLARDLLSDFRITSRLYPQTTESETKRLCLDHASMSSCCLPLLKQIEAEWKEAVG